MMLTTVSANAKKERRDHTDSLIEATMSTMFPTYRYMSTDTRERFHRFCDDMITSTQVHAGAPINCSLIRLLRLMKVDLIVVSPSGSIVDGSHYSVASSQVGYAGAGASNSKTKEPDAGATDEDMHVHKKDRDVCKLEKEFKKVIQKKDRRARLLAFMRTGIRAEVDPVTAKDPVTDQSRSIHTIADHRDNGFNSSWKRLGAWHRRAALQAYIDKMDEAENTAFGISVELLQKIRTTIAGPLLRNVSSLPEPTYHIKSGSITSLRTPASASSTPRKVRGGSKRPVHVDGRSRKKMNYLLQNMKKLRDKRRDLENRSVGFTGTFVSIN